MPNFKRNVLEGVPFTPVPDYFLTEIMTELSPTELRVMLYIYLHTVGYGKKADSISYEQFVSGITTRDGKRLDNGAGVSRRALVTALINLEHKGLIERVQTRFNLSVIRLCLPPTTVTEEMTGHNIQLYITKTPIEQPLVAVGDAAGNDKLSHPEKEMQMLHSDKGQEVQKIPTEVQMLHSTIEESHEKHESHDHEEDVNHLVLPSQLIPDPDKERDLSPTVKKISKSNPKTEPIVETMISHVPELTITNAERLVGIARANKRDDSYLRDLVLHVSNNPRIHTPAAVLTSLVKSNQTRSAKKPKPTGTPLPINFDKYRQFQSVVECSQTSSRSAKPPVIQSGVEELRASVQFPTTETITERESEGKPILADKSILGDSRLKFALQQRNPQLAAYLREIRIVPGKPDEDEGDELVLRFIGKPVPDSFDWWLSDVQIYHPNVRSIRLAGV
jgi:hypothetical protein